MGKFTYGTDVANKTITIAENMKFSTGKIEGNSYKANKSVWDNKGTVKNSTNQNMFTINGTAYNIFNTIVGNDDKLEEQDLINLMNKPSKNIKVTTSGNGVYLVEYTVNGYEDNYKAYMQFDFETADEKAQQEQDEQAAAAEKAKREAEQQRIKDEEAAQKSNQEEQSWFSRYWTFVKNYLSYKWTCE